MEKNEMKETMCGSLDWQSGRTEGQGLPQGAITNQAFEQSEYMKANKTETYMQLRMWAIVEASKYCATPDDILAAARRFVEFTLLDDPPIP